MAGQLLLIQLHQGDSDHLQRQPSPQNLIIFGAKTSLHVLNPWARLLDPHKSSSISLSWTHLVLPSQHVQNQKLLFSLFCTGQDCLRSLKTCSSSAPAVKVWQSHETHCCLQCGDRESHPTIPSSTPAARLRPSIFIKQCYLASTLCQQLCSG